MAQRAADQITLIDLADGVSVMLSSESYAFPGTTTNAIAGNTTTKVQAVQGGEYVAASVNLASITKPTGVTVTSDNHATSPTLTIAVASSVTSGGEVVIPVVVGDITVEKKFSFSITFTGATGATGSQGTAATTVTSGVDAVAIPTDTAGATVAATSITIPFGAYVGTTRVAVTVAASGLPTGITVGTNTAGTVSADGSLVLSIASGSTLGGTDTGTITLTYTANGLTFVRRLTWAKAYKGATGATGSTGSTGTSATYVDIRNDNFSIVTNSSGSTSSATTVTVAFAGYIGNTRAAATAVVSGLPTGITAGTNTPATTGADGSVILNIASGSSLGGTSTGNITFSITCNGITFPMVVSWSKAIGGATGAAGAAGTTMGLFNEAQMIPADANGATLSAQTINVNFFGYVGSARAAVTAAVGTLPTGMTVGTNTPGTTGADGVLTFNVAAGSTLGDAASGQVTVTLTCNSIPRAFIFSWAKSQQGSPGITLEISSAMGLVFKNTQIATTLTATVYQAGVVVTGPALTALGTIKWYKDGVYMTGNDGATLTIAAGDVTDSSTYSAQLEY